MSRRRVGALLLVGALSSALVAGASPAPVDAATADAGVDVGVTVPTSTATGSFGDVDDAELRWGLNREASSGAFAGGCNFLSAGVAGDSGSARVWAESDGLYAPRAGAVSIEKATSDGGWTAAAFATRCTDPAGRPVSASSLSSSTQSQVVMDGGSGRVTADGLTLRWSGSFTVAFYGGMTYWSASDPVLELDAAGNGRLTATASGYGTTMEDTSIWRPLPETEVVLAEVRGAPLDGGGFRIVPEYLGVASQTGGQAPRTADNAAYWGSFPASFMDFQTQTGQAAYWLTSGGLRDPAKPASALLVNFDAAAPAVAAVPDALGSDEAAAPDRATPGVAAGGSAAGAAPAATGLASEPTTVVRDGGGLVPEATAGSPLVVLVAGALALALLVGTLAALHLSGRRIVPWPRRRPTAQAPAPAPPA